MKSARRSERDRHRSWGDEKLERRAAAATEYRTSASEMHLTRRGCPVSFRAREKGTERIVRRRKAGEVPRCQGGAHAGVETRHAGAE